MRASHRESAVVVVQSTELTGNNVTCAVCETMAHVRSLRKRHVARHNDKAYTLQYCSKCKLQFWSPLKADPSVYESEGFEAYKDYHAGARPFPRWSEPLFHVLPAGQGTALDIGCGDGAVLHRLAQAGFEPNGIDLDKKSIAVARQKFGLDKVVACTLEEYAAHCQLLGLQFDLITFFEVLEHQDAPLEFLGQVMRLGKPGGMVAGSVPNRDRFLARLDRYMSVGDLPPHHFLWFSQDCLLCLLQRAGFQTITVAPTGTMSYSQVLSKIHDVVARRMRGESVVIKIAAWILKAAAPFAAIVPWLGMRFAPSHLFFKCAIPTSSAFAGKQIS